MPMTREELLKIAIQLVCVKNRCSAKDVARYLDSFAAHSWLWAIREEFKRLATQEKG